MVARSAPEYRARRSDSIWLVRASRAPLDSGFATPHWPVGWPGGGKTLAEQKVIYEELARADAPRLILFFVK